MTTSASPDPALTAFGSQTWLTGDEVYLRPVVPDDAETIASWRPAAFPVSPDRARAWITDALAKASDPYGRATWLIARRRDERSVGSVSVDFRRFPHHNVEAAMDPLLGEDALRWKAEAVALVFRMIGEEQQRPKVAMYLPADETPVREALEALGARATARFREKLAGPGGTRRDDLIVEWLHPDWVARLGDPAGTQPARSGTGQPRPVVPPRQPDGDPPANAVRIGPRVYLRPPQRSDACDMARLSMRETDAIWDTGRQPRGVTSAEQWIRSWQQPSPPHTLDLSICLRDTGAFIGLVGVLGVDWRHRYGESASMILDPAWREAGYGSEAKHLLFDWLFNTLDIHAIQSWVHFDNPRSAAALRKQGYREAGVEHWVRHCAGGFASFQAFDLLADEWRAMPRGDSGAP